MKNIINFIYKHPIWVLLFVFVLLIGSALGIGGVNVATGNQTLVKDDTDTFKDNQAYQEQFGGETIVLHLESNNDLLALENIQLFNQLEENLSFQDGVFSYLSPATMVKNISKNQYDQFKLGLGQMGLALKDVSQMLSQNAGNLQGYQVEDIETAGQDINNAVIQIKNGQTNLSDALLQWETVLLSVDGVLVQLESDLEDDGHLTYANQVQQVNTQMTQLLEQFSQIQAIPGQSETALELLNQNLSGLFTQLVSQLSQINSFVDQLTVLSQNLDEMANTLLLIESSWDSFYPGIPKTQASLEKMVFDNNTRRSMFDVFIIDESYVMMQITLEGDVTKEEKQAIISLLEDGVEESDFDGSYLLSGKAVLDLSIQNSMVSSMQKMLLLSIGLMVLILLVTFKVKWRILPLITVLLALIMTIGLMGYLSIPVTMVSMAVFPILIGLGIDYSIQFHNRYSSALEEETSHE